MSDIKRVLIEIGHPAQVHQFKYLYRELEKQGVEVLIAAKQKEVSEYLLEAYGLNYKIIDKTRKGLIAKLITLPKVYYNMFKIIKSFKPNIILSRFSFQSSHLAKILNIPHIGFTDTEHVNLSDKLTVPFVDIKITAKSYFKNLGNNHFRYDGNIELFYLHPKRFSPDFGIKKELGLRDDERYAIVRFVSWDAHHDVGQAGLNRELKLELVEKLSRHLKVFITSEKELPSEFNQYQINISPDRIHHALAFSDLYIGEGGTMASESACLGIPSIYVNSLDAGVFKEQEKYGLLYSFRNSEGVIDKAVELASNHDIKFKHKKKLDLFLANKIDVTSFITSVVLNYPDSISKMKSNDNYYQKFK